MRKPNRCAASRGNVDDAVAVIGPAVVDAHDQRAAVGEIGHSRVARQRQRRVRRGNPVEVEDLAVCGQAAVEIVAVPGGETRGLIMRIFLGDVGAAGDRVRRPDMVAAAALGHRIAVGDDTRAWRNAVARVDAIRAIGEKRAEHGAGADRRKTSQLSR